MLKYIPRRTLAPRRMQRLLIVLLIPVLVFAANSLWWHPKPVIAPRLDHSAAELILDPFEASDIAMRKKVHFTQYKFLWADAVESRAKSWKALAKMPVDKRCEVFFGALEDEIPDWTLEWRTDPNYLVRIDDKARFFRRRKDGTQEEMERAFSKSVAATIAEDQRLADSMTIIRTFGHCFLHPDRIFPAGRGRELFDRYSAKVAPYLATRSSAPGENPLEHHYNIMKGAGIVISATNRHVTDLVRLLYLLRALDNALPIQVMHRLDLLVKSQRAIMRAATALREEALSAPMLDRTALEQHLKYAGVDGIELTQMQFPPQQVEIVDIKDYLSKPAQSKFTRYNNKLIALAFTSFEQALLMDADVVPLVAPAQLLSTREFVDTGTFFFRDRTVPFWIHWPAANRYARLMPHRTNTVDMVMGISPVTGKTLDNAVMRGWYHHQESGIVAFDRKKHFAALFTLLPLALWPHPVGSLSWGEKEMFWMAMAMAGKEEYAFNANAGASVGQLTAKPDFLHYPNAQVPELCSTHIGHVGADGTLLWMNGGFLHCKFKKWEKDRTVFPYDLSPNTEAMDALYTNPMRIRHAIVGPELPFLHSAEIEVLPSRIAAVRQRQLQTKNLQNNGQVPTSSPIFGWFWRGTCSRADMCAYEKYQAVEGMPKSLNVGRVFEFDEDTYKKYDVLGALWLAARNE